MSFAVSVALLAAVVSLTTALPGVVLVLRRQAMLSDALSHAVLPGIAISALWASSPRDPILLVGATIGGVVVIAATEWLRARGRFTEDSATGLIFPAFFAIGVILISTRFAGSMISEHTVLVGDLNIAAMSHWIVGGYDLGPKDMWIVGGAGVVTLVVLILARRPLTIATFDPVFARTMLVTHSQGAMLAVTLLVALISSQVGFWVAYKFNTATSPTMAFVDGLLFLAVWVVVRLRSRT